ncbi:MAG: hypothetical protein ACREYC_13165 [Gammaproteobacteria bacterium]
MEHILHNALQIRRLYYLTSHLNAGAKTRIAGWKVEIARADSFTSPQATAGPIPGMAMNHRLNG